MSLSVDGVVLPLGGVRHPVDRVDDYMSEVGHFTSGGGREGPRVRPEGWREGDDAWICGPPFGSGVGSPKVRARSPCAVVSFVSVDVAFALDAAGDAACEATGHC